jgi:hypothetical protein
MVGNASGFDDGGAEAVAKCGIPDMAALAATQVAGETAGVFGATPGNAQYWALGPANYIKATYPNVVGHAAMIYLNVPVTSVNALNQVKAYKSVGFNFGTTSSQPLRRTPTTRP